MKKFITSFFIAAIVSCLLFIFVPKVESRPILYGPAKACITTFINSQVYRDVVKGSNAIVAEVEAKCGSGADMNGCDPIPFSLAVEDISGAGDHQYTSGIWTPNLCDGQAKEVTCHIIPLFPGTIYNYVLDVNGQPLKTGQIVP